MRYAAPMILSTFALLAAALPNDDWPEFRGPDRNSTVAAVDSDFDWGAEGPEIVWRTSVGPGYGGAAVRDGEVVLLDREVGREDFLRVLDLESGEELWSAAYPAEGRLNYAGSRTVPSIQDGMIVSVGGFGHVTGYDREKREIAWTVDLREDYGGRLPYYGWSASPLVVGDLVVVPALGEEVGLVALDLETGEERWATYSVGYSHSTPALLELLGREQLLFLSRPTGPSAGDRPVPTTLTSFHPKTGEMLWQDEIDLASIPIPSPIRIDDERFLVTGGYRAGTTLLRLSRAGGSHEVEVLFHVDRGSQTHTPILHADHVYLLANENWNYQARKAEGGLMCLGLDGEESWRTSDEPYFGRGNAILAGDHLLIQDGFNGVLRVARATPDGYLQIAEADVFGADRERDGRMWAPMALARGCLLMRSQDELLCVRL